MARRSNPARRVRPRLTASADGAPGCPPGTWRAHAPLSYYAVYATAVRGRICHRWGRRAANRCRPRRSTGHLRARRPPTAARNVAPTGADGDAGRRVLRLARTARLSFRFVSTNRRRPDRSGGQRAVATGGRLAIDSGRARGGGRRRPTDRCMWSGGSPPPCRTVTPPCTKDNLAYGHPSFGSRIRCFYCTRNGRWRLQWERSVASSSVR
jgi:hypothetical protein